jgi:hypothetical protein
MALDYSTLSDAELTALQNEDYSKLSDTTLQALSETPTEAPKPKSEGLSPVGAGVGAAGLTAAAKMVPKVRKILPERLGGTPSAATMAAAGTPTASSMQRYLQGALEAEGVKDPVTLAKLAQATGMPVNQPSEVQAAVKSLREVPPTPGERVPVKKMVDGVEKIVRYNELPGTPGRPAIDPKTLVEEKSLGKTLSKVGGGLGSIARFAQGPLTVGAVFGGLQDIANRKETDPTGALISGIGTAGAAVSPWFAPAAGIPAAAAMINYARDNPEYVAKVAKTPKYFRRETYGFADGGLVQHFNGGGAAMNAAGGQEVGMYPGALTTSNSLAPMVSTPVAVGEPSRPIAPAVEPVQAFSGQSPNELPASNSMSPVAAASTSPYTVHPHADELLPQGMVTPRIGMAEGGSPLPEVSLDTKSIPSMTGQPGVGYMQTPQGAMARLQMEKELENARLRAGVSGMAMSIPGMHGVKMMPGQMDVGANMGIGPGRLDVSANRSINPIPGKGHMQGVRANYTIPFAEGGDVKKSDANEGAAFIGYPQINKNRKIGSGTGFLDALVGAPPSRENILNPSDYSYMQGYEKGEPYGIAAMALPFAGMAAKPLAKEIGTRAFMGESLTPKMMRQLMPEAPAMGIIKPEKGGNWMPGNIRPGEHWTPEDQLAETLGFNKNDPALENWVNTQLTRYVKNDMGTPGDPIRALADQGILHYKPRPAYSAHNNQPTNLQREAELKRTYANTPEGESALTSLGKDWETNVDAGIKTKTIGPKTIEAYGEEYPWLKNAEGKKLHSIDDEFLYSHLGFDHMVDVLREQIAAGQLRPESLKSLSVPQAVQRVHEYNLAKEKAMQKIKLQADSEMPVAKEYPEGYKWLELKHPTDKNMTEAALKYEGDAMGHCVGGYCPDVLAGDTKIYSLRDAKGEPHVTVEVKNKAEPWMNETHWDSANNFHWKANVPLSPEMKAEIDAEMVKKFGNSRNFQQKESRWDFLESELRKRLGEPEPKLSIEQIKGKQNAAPKDEYKKFVQDFVRSGNWERVNEAHNAGLKDMAKTGNNYELTNVPEDINKLPHTERYWAVQEAIANKDIPKYATEEEVADAIRKYARKP